MVDRISFAYHPRNYIHHIALQAQHAGIGIIPVRADGTKQPALASWRQYQQRQATVQELYTWFHTPDVGIAFITGTISGGLEALDFDSSEVYTAWIKHIRQSSRLSALYSRISWGYEEATPSGGRHLLYRTTAVEGNRKLALSDHGKRRKTLIETRGQGGLIIVAPSRGGVHPSGKAYILLRGGVQTIQCITPKEREALFESMGAFNETISEKDDTTPMYIAPPRRYDGEGDMRPGDVYNHNARWEEVLCPHHWQLVRTVMHGGHLIGYWRRPDKDDLGCSATTNYHGHDLLTVFSTSTLFDVGRSYTKFAAYTLLNHGGNFSAAARELAERGYVCTTH